MCDYEELVRALRENAEWADGNIWEVPIMLPDNLKQAADAIEELQSYADLYKELTEKGQTVARKLIDAYPKWISVEDRLPEESANYLTYGVFLPLGVKAMDLCRFNGNGWMIDQNVKITHWMPLPEPQTTTE